MLLAGLFVLLTASQPQDPFRRLTVICVGVTAVVVGLRIWTFFTVPQSNQGWWFPTHLRLDSLLFGVLLSYYYHRVRAFPAAVNRVTWRLVFLGLLLPGCLADDSEPAPEVRDRTVVRLFRIWRRAHRVAVRVDPHAPERPVAGRRGRLRRIVFLFDLPVARRRLRLRRSSDSEDHRHAGILRALDVSDRIGTRVRCDRVAARRDAGPSAARSVVPVEGIRRLSRRLSASLGRTSRSGPGRSWRSGGPRSRREG